MSKGKKLQNVAFPRVTFQWETGDEGRVVAKKIEAAIEKHEKGLARNKVTITTDWTRSILNLLDQNINHWQKEFKNYRLRRPNEQSEIIERINRHAKDLLRDIERLGLPIYALRYFANDEILALHADLFCKKDYEPNFEDIDGQLREYLEFFDGNIPISDVRFDLLLVKLTDKTRLHEIANRSLLTKTNIDQPEVTYIIRKLAIYFNKRYGKTLPTTIANICAAIYPDAEIVYDKVQNKLRGFSLT